MKIRHTMLTALFVFAAVSATAAEVYEVPDVKREVLERVLGEKLGVDRVVIKSANSRLNGIFYYLDIEIFSNSQSYPIKNCFLEVYYRKNRKTTIRLEEWASFGGCKVLYSDGLEVEVRPVSIYRKDVGLKPPIRIKRKIVFPAEVE